MDTHSWSPQPWDIMRDILHGTSLESLLASLPKVAYKKQIYQFIYFFNFFFGMGKGSSLPLLDKPGVPNMLPNVLPTRSDFIKKIPRCYISLHKLFIYYYYYSLFFILYFFYISENNIIGVEAAKVVP